MRRLLPLALLTLVLPGCPSFGILGNTNLDPRILAVTSKDARGLPSAFVRLDWKAITDVSNYEVSGRAGDGPTAVLTRTSRLEFLDDKAAPEATLSYSVRALSGTGEEKAKSSELTVKVLSSQVSAPAELAENDTPISKTDIRRTTQAKPKLGWSTVAGDNIWYYVVVSEHSAGNEAGTVYAALLKSSPVELGTLTHESVQLAGFPQVKDRLLAAGKNYFYTVTTLRSDAPELANAKAVDIAVSEPRELAYRTP